MAKHLSGQIYQVCVLPGILDSTLKLRNYGLFTPRPGADESGLAVAPAKSHGKLALALAVIAIGLSLVLGEAQTQLARQQAAAEQQRANQATQQAEDIGNSERRNSHNCNRLSRRSLKRVARRWG